MGDRTVERRQAANMVLFHCLGSIDGPLPESNIVRTIMEFLSFLHLKGMGVFFHLKWHLGLWVSQHWQEKKQNSMEATGSIHHSPLPCVRTEAHHTQTSCAWAECH